MEDRRDVKYLLLDPRGLCKNTLARTHAQAHAMNTQNTACHALRCMIDSSSGGESGGC